MKIWEYLSHKGLYGSGLNQMEKQVLKCLADNDPKVKEQLKKDWDQWLCKQELGGEE